MKDLSAQVLGLSINSCKVNGIEFKNAVTKYDYYEDIFTNYVSGSLVISASSAFQDKLKWSGNETLELEIDKPESQLQNIRIFPLKGKYRIFDIKARKLGNDSNENYYITFCSPSLVLSEQTKISKSYKNKRISDIIKDIATTYLGIPSNIYIEQTLGLRDIVIPKLKPFEAINWLCTQAIADDLPKPLQSGAEYLFWANRDGYRCQSIIKLYKDMVIYRNPFSAAQSGLGRGTTPGYWYGTKNTEQQLGNDTPNWDPYEHILSFEVMNTYDTVESSQRGVYGNRLLALDYLRRTHENADFKYNEYWGYLNSNIKMFKDPQYNDIRPFDTISDSEIGRSVESTIKIYPSTTRQKESEYLQNIGMNPPANYVESFVPYRYAQLGLVSHHRLKLVIPGDPYIAVGYIIRVNFGRTSRQMDDTGEKEDRTLSGYYLITALRHSLDQENQFMTTLEVVKEAKHKPNM